MLPQQYIKLSKFAEIGVNGKWYIDKDNDTFTVYIHVQMSMYAIIHFIIIHVHVFK